MKSPRTTFRIFCSALALAIGALVLRWLESRYLLNAFVSEAYLVWIAMIFSASGIWLGWHLSNRPKMRKFEQDEQMIESLGITKRELDVLSLLASGCSNKEIASQLYVSLSTIKTHLIHLYQKLQVSRRTQAIHRAKTLKLIP